MTRQPPRASRLLALLDLLRRLCEAHPGVIAVSPWLRAPGR